MFLSCNNTFLPGGSMDNMWEKLKKGVREGAALSMEKNRGVYKIGEIKGRGDGYQAQNRA
jgi:hypothetical protein